MPATIEKKKVTSDRTAATEKKPTNTIKKPIQKKTITKKPTTTATATTSTDNTEEPKLTQGQKLLIAATAQRAAKKALLKGVTSTKISFDEEGNEKVETVVKKIEKKPAAAVVVHPKKSTGDSANKKVRPAMKKPDPITSKRKATDEVKEKEESESKKEEKKAPKKQKKQKKTKIEIEEQKKDTKKEDALAYVRSFAIDREHWKFKKIQQVWLLQNLYEIPEDEFDHVLEYLKDLQGSARENTRKEAQAKIPESNSNKPAITNSLTGYANVTDNNDDDFDAEKLLAQATAAPVVPVTVEEEEEDKEDETLEIKRAKSIVEILL